MIALGREVQNRAAPVGVDFATRRRILAAGGHVTGHGANLEAAMVRRVLVACGLLVAVWLNSVQSHQFGLPWPAGAALAVALTAPLAFSMRRPLLVWQLLAAVLTGCSFIFGAVVGPGYNDAGWPWPMPATLGFAFVLFQVGCRTVDRLLIVAVGALTVLVVFGSGYLVASTSVSTLLYLTAMAAALLFWGDSIRTRKDAQRALAEETERRRRDQQRASILRERSRIARELHDLVAHHISMIAIQSEAAPHRIADLPAEAHRTFEAIRSASREALMEMRRVLGLLRQNDDTEAENAPQPGIDGLTGLIENAEKAGLRATLSIIGSSADAPAGVAVSTYRIVREALGNAAQHAPGTEVVVTVMVEVGRVALSVVDTGPARGKRPGGPGTGLGLIGIRERVMALGGTFRAGPSEDGGFQVFAELPVHDRVGAAE